MLYKIEKNKNFKKFCLKRRLKKLEKKKTTEIENFICSHPSQASRMDNIESNISSEYFSSIELKIKAAKRLLSQISKN